MKTFFSILILGIFLVERPHAQNEVTTKEDIVLETIGSISAHLMYQTYISIGAIADGFTADGYSLETLNLLMLEHISSCKNIHDQIQKLIDSGFVTNSEDVQYLKDAIKTIDLLQAEATALQQFAHNKTEENAKLFQSHRENAWIALDTLLDAK